MEREDSFVQEITHNVAFDYIHFQHSLAILGSFELPRKVLPSHF